MAIALTDNLLANAILLLMLLSLSMLTSCEANKGGLALRGAVQPHPRLVDRKDPTEKIFNVLQFGVKGDSKTDNALNFIRAWKTACDYKGKARLVIPKGVYFASEMIFAGPCQNTAPTIVHILGTIKAASDLSNYAEDFWILFQNVNGLIVTGSGTIDGQGNNVWKYNDGGGSVFPASIKLYHVNNGIIKQLTSVNPMGFHFSIVLSENIRAKNLHLVAPEDSPNTDGVHISQSKQVKIVRSVIATGDDCVGMIHGSTDITIKKVLCGPGHGISIGSLGKRPDEKDVRGIVVTNCTLKNTDNGIRIKTWAGSPPGLASGLTFQDIIMENVKNPIIIDQSYGSKSNSPSKVQISDVKYMNIRGTSASEVGVNLECSKQFPCKGVQMSNINLKYSGAKKEPFISACQNAKVSYNGVQFPPPCSS